MPKFSYTTGYPQIERNLKRAANLLSANVYEQQLWSLANDMREDVVGELKRMVYDTAPGKYRRTGFLMATIYKETHLRDDFNERYAKGRILVSAAQKKPAESRDYVAVRGGNSPKKLEVKLCASAIYADRVEFGPHVRGARPFMRAALNRNAARYVAILSDNLRSVLSGLGSTSARGVGGRFV